MDPWLEKSKRKLFLMLAVIVFLVYGNALFNGFVYDDHYLIIDNTFIKDLKYIPTFFANDVTVTSAIGRPSGYYRPVSMVFLALEYRLWGLSSFWFHFGNIFLHFINSCLVFAILKEITRNKRLSFFAGLVFAAHPIHVEAVTPIYNYMGILASFFSFSSFLAFIKNKDGNKNALPFVLFALGLFSKEEVLILPLIFVLYDFYFVCQFSFSGLVKKWRKYFWFIFIVCFYLFIRLTVLGKDTAAGLWALDPSLNFNIEPAPSLLLHLLTIAKVYFQYISLLVFPSTLCAFHIVPSVKSFFEPLSLASLFVVVGLISFFFSSQRKNPTMSFFIGVFFVSTLPISNLVPIGGIFGERFMYLPSIAYCFFAAYILDKMVHYVGKKQRSGLIYLAFFILLFFYAQKTMIQNYTWRTDISLWKNAATKSPSAITYINLGEAYEKAGLLDEAVQNYRAALKFTLHKEFLIRNTMGKIYGERKMYDAALDEFKKVLELNPDFVEAYYNTGITYFHKKDWNSAAAYFKRAIDGDAKYPWGYYGLGLIEEKGGNSKEAHRLFEIVVNLSPGFPLALEGIRRLEQADKSR